MVLSAAEPENICERVRELEPANLNPHPGPFPPPTNATSNNNFMGLTNGKLARSLRQKRAPGVTRQSMVYGERRKGNGVYQHLSA